VYNANPFRGKDSKLVAAADFLPEEPGHELTEEEKTEQFKAFFESLKIAQEAKLAAAAAQTP
jgi:hypothetical protein